MWHVLEPFYYPYGLDRVYCGRLVIYSLWFSVVESSVHLEFLHCLRAGLNVGCDYVLALLSVHFLLRSWTVSYRDAGCGERRRQRSCLWAMSDT